MMLARPAATGRGSSFGLPHAAKETASQRPCASLLPCGDHGLDWDLSFNVNVPKYEDKRYSDYRRLQIHGVLLRPRKLKVETVELIFFSVSVVQNTSLP
jgi:hypothetical protein